MVQHPDLNLMVHQAYSSVTHNNSLRMTILGWVHVCVNYSLPTSRQGNGDEADD